jgi:hypothetical protein
MFRLLYSACVSMALAFLLTMDARAQITVPAGYEVHLLRISSQPEGPSLAIDPANRHILYAAVGSWGPHSIIRVDLSGDTITTSTFATGAYNLAGPDDEDNALDSLFATASGLAVLSTGELIIVDNNEITGPPPVPGDTIYLAQDLNGDGDARDIVDVGGVPTPEVVELITPINTLPGTGWGGFTGQQAEVDGADNVYIVTADGSGQGEVLRVSSPLTSPSISVFFEGLDYGAGLGFDQSGTLYVGNNSYPNPAGLLGLRDRSVPPDGDAMDAGEMDIISSGTLSGIYDLALDADDRLFITNGNRVQLIDGSTGATSDFATFPLYYFLGDLVFDDPTRPFHPQSGPNGAQLIIADGDFDGCLTIITPSQPTHAELWTLYY